MVLLDKIQSVYFIGIGGIGMSALARFFKKEGKNVAGYDRTQTQLTRKLAEEGIGVKFDDNVETIALPFRDRETCLVVYTPAIPAGHSELGYFMAGGFEIKKRAEVLGLLTRGMDGICIAGTHGKTTISSMTAHLLTQSAVGCNAFLGGITKNYSTNFLHDEQSRYVVMEADEFDRSFLQLSPHLALISAVDADHLDIYGEPSRVVEAFNAFVQLINPGGALVFKKGLEIEWPDDEVEVFTYSAEDKADFHPLRITLVEGLYTFDLQTPLGMIKGLRMGIPGLVNVENAVGALALALLAGAEPEELKRALPSFEGIKRRFEYRIKQDGMILIDDYAHHPEEINATIKSVRALYPGKELTVVFQPHLYTRTRDFADGFAAALDKGDRVLLLDIYPAREEAIAGVSSRMLMERMNLERVSLVDDEQLIRDILSRPPEVLLTIGAGDIDKKVDVLEKELLGLSGKG